MLTDERIEELCWTEMDRRLLSFARAIEAEATKPQEHKPLGPATAEDQAIYNSIVSNYFESGALDWMQNIDAAMKEPSFQEARALMGTENYGQDVALLQALRCLRSRMSNVTKPQEPVHWRAVLCAEQVPQHPTPTAHVVGFRKFSDAESWVAAKLDFDGWRYTLEPLFATPQPCPKCAEKQSAIDVWEGRYADLSAKCAELEDFCISQGNELAKLDEKVFDQDRLLKQQAEKISATLVALAGLPDGALDGGWTYAGMNKYALGLEVKCAELKAEVLSKEGMALVTKEDAENYCRILSLLGMEEEGSPIEGVEHLISLRDGMTCGDCNDTGWLENREEGRYPCTCMTEAEPYQILVAERDALAITVQQMREALEVVNVQLIEGKIFTQQMHKRPYWRYSVSEALTLPDTSEIIKRHDAAVLRKAADTTLSEQSVLLDGMHGYTALKIQGLMIESLHLKADELEK